MLCELYSLLKLFVCFYPFTWPRALWKKIEIQPFCAVGVVFVFCPMNFSSTLLFFFIQHYPSLRFYRLHSLLPLILFVARFSPPVPRHVLLFFHLAALSNPFSNRPLSP